MKQIKTTELTGYEPIDQKLVAGYSLFDLMENNLSNSILHNLYDLEKTDLDLAKSILYKHFHYRELRFTEGIFVTTSGNPPVILATKSKKSKYDNERYYLNQYLCDDNRREEHLENYLLGLQFYATTAHLEFGSIFHKFLMLSALITSLLAILFYPLIDASNTVLIMLIATYAFINLMRNMAMLMELELEKLKYHNK